MFKIEIVWMVDEHDCDTCGSSYAEGARVYFDDVSVLDMEPCAHCFDGNTYTKEQVYNRILVELGHMVVITND